jgi:hypothetical protein
MKNKSIPLIAAAALSLVLPSAALAQTDGSVLFNPTVDLSTLNQNNFVGYVGGKFLSAGPETVNYLGFYDAGGDGLATDHTIALWETGWNGQSSRGQLFSETVSAATWTSAPLLGGYRWVQLSSPVTLVGNEYYLLNASVDGVDAWGDTISGSQITWNSQYVPGVGDTGYDFSRNGVYGDSIPSYNDSGAGGSIFPAANLGFNVVPAPEPATLSLMGIGMAAVLGFMRKQRR